MIHASLLVLLKNSETNPYISSPGIFFTSYYLIRKIHSDEMVQLSSCGVLFTSHFTYIIMLVNNVSIIEKESKRLEISRDDDLLVASLVQLWWCHPRAKSSQQPRRPRLEPASWQTEIRWCPKFACHQLFHPSYLKLWRENIKIHFKINHFIKIT